MGFDPNFEHPTCVAALKSSDRTKQSVCGWQYIYRERSNCFLCIYISFLFVRHYKSIGDLKSPDIILPSSDDGSLEPKGYNVDFFCIKLFYLDYFFFQISPYWVTSKSPRNGIQGSLT